MDVPELIQHNMKYRLKLTLFQHYLNCIKNYQITLNILSTNTYYILNTIYQILQIKYFIIYTEILYIKFNIIARSEERRVGKECW